jgi:predicted RNA-binding protein with RPS1 domain
MVDFGVFVKLEEGLEGLVHISEIDWGLVDDPRHFFKVGDKVKVKIIDIKDGKISSRLNNSKTILGKLLQANTTKATKLRVWSSNLTNTVHSPLSRRVSQGLVHVSSLAPRRSFALTSSSANATPSLSPSLSLKTCAWRSPLQETRSSATFRKSGRFPIGYGVQWWTLVTSTTG